MHITQVTPGVISIPPNGWGAVEKIIWEYKLNIEKLGHQCDIKYLNDIDITKTDIVHIHMANLAIEAANRGIPYVFSLHDHHVVHHGKDSFRYKENLEAMKRSVISFTHAEFLVDFFEETDKLFYLSHGVNSEYFVPKKLIRNEQKLLCLANNGIGGDNTYDRKGFRFAIEAAKMLDLPITIAGPENNMTFFNANPDLLKYSKINLVCNNPNEEEILRLYQEHSIFLHPSILEAGHPNLTILEALSCGLPVVGTYDGSQKLDGFVKIQRDSNSVKDGIKNVLDDYSNHALNASITGKKYDWSIVVNRMIKMFETSLLVKKEYTSDITKDLYIQTYESVSQNKNNFGVFKINLHNINGLFVELLGDVNFGECTVEVYDENDSLYYTNNINPNNWVKLNRKYFTDWRIKVLKDGVTFYDGKLDFNGKRVLISFDSSSLGDTIAWIPYCEEFRKKHNCDVIVSTFKNNLLEKVYPNLIFVEPGTIVNDIFAQYTFGWFYDKEKEPIKPNLIPLQQTASNILGLDFKEIHSKIYFESKERPYSEKYVCIATNSTAGCKLWNNPMGWKDLTSYLLNKGYKVVNISKDGDRVEGVENISDDSMENTMNVIHHSEFVIGLSSGLSWLSWGLGKHVVMISNFTEQNHEFTINCTRITNHSVCNGCWNSPLFKFDKGDWNWCPEHKGTDRQFECHKSITSDMVINKIQHLL